MKLTITKSQSKGGMRGRISFEVQVQAQLTEEERNLVKDYKLETELLVSGYLPSFSIDSTKKPNGVSLRVYDLIGGATYKGKDVIEATAYIASAKEACRKLKSYLEDAHTFGGEEVYEIELAEPSETTNLSQDEHTFG